MNDELQKRIEAQEIKLEKIYVSVEKTRKYILWAVVLTIVATLIPLIGLLFTIPQYLNQLNSITGM